MPYFTYEPERAPPWLQNPKGRDFLRARGDVKDSLAQQVIFGVEQRFPTAATPSALAALASERGIVRGPDESLEAWVVRIRAAWDIWASAGTALGLLRALASSGIPDARVSIARARQFQLSGDQLATVILPAGSFLMRLEFWSEFIIIVDRPQPGLNWSVPTVAQQNLVAVLAETFKPAFATYNGLVVVTQGQTLGYSDGRPRTMDDWGIPSLGYSSATFYPAP